MMQDCDDLLWIKDPQLLWPDTVPEDTREPRKQKLP